MKKDLFQSIVIMVIGIAILVLTVGMTYYNSMLDSLTDSIAMKNNWNIGIQNVSDVSTNLNKLDIVEPATIINGNMVEYKLTMSNESYYNFDTQVKNSGNMSAIISSISLIGADDLNYTVSANVGDVIQSGQTKDIKVTLLDNNEDSYEDSYNISLVINFVQK